ncbi:MAG: SOS response-associated peptidase family protein, partial [Nitrospinae bacterium]|nr:SOS response-associated peptidase family protein [Nitrospinota bacterium]
MCGRYTLTKPAKTIQSHFAFMEPKVSHKKRYNIAPTQQAPVVMLREGKRELLLMRWGLIPPWSKDEKMGSRMINARAETIQEKPSFKNSFKTKRDANAATPQFVFEPTLESYSAVLLKSASDNGLLIGFGIFAVLATLVVIGLFAKRIPLPTKAIYWGIAAALALIVWSLPTIVNTAEFYDNFINTIIIATGAVIISIAIGAPAGYALARYTGISGVVILLAAIAFRSMPRLGYILPYLQVSQDIGLWDTYVLVIIVLV